MTQGRCRPLYPDPQQRSSNVPGEHYLPLQLRHHSPWLQPADGGNGKGVQDLSTRVISSLIAPPVEVGEKPCVHGGLLPIETDPPGEQP